jgi:hypothetical protein
LLEGRRRFARRSALGAADDIDRLPLGDGGAGAVFLVEALSTCRTRSGIPLAEIARVLHPGGRFG